MAYRLGRDVSSLSNWIDAHDVTYPNAEIGMAATILMWTDTHAATVIAVSESGKTVTVQHDEAIRVDANGLSHVQEYEYRRNPRGQTEQYRRDKQGVWRKLGGGSALRLGVRKTYIDPEF